MNKAHLTILAVLFAASAVLGAVAITHTTRLGAASRSATDAAVAKQTKQLSLYAAKLRQQLHTKTPSLPAMPKVAAASSSAPAAPAAPAAPRIVYQQPPPVVVTLHHHSDDGSDGGGDGGDD
jgi:hypothetical protein